MERNKLNARDLMLGDWILAKGEVGLVNLIDETPDTPLIGIAPRDLVMIDKCEAIPLTPEFLNKSSQTLKKSRQEWTWYSDDNGNYLEIVQDIKDKSFWVSVNGDEYRLYEIRYLHELQHALRLCGIDKEITL